MKLNKIILVLLTLLISPSIKAQDFDMSKFDYLEHYVGVWEGNSNDTDSISISFYLEEEYFEPLNQEFPSLKGKFIYYSDKSQKIFTSKSDTSSIIGRGRTQPEEKPFNIRLGFKDPVTGDIGSLYLRFEHGSDTVATWNLYQPEGIYISTDKMKPKVYRYSVPRTMIIRKIE